MPRVPTYDNFQVAPNTQQGRVGVDYSPSQAAIPFKQMEQMGQAVENLGNSMSKIQIDMLQEANKLRVDDALNRAKEESIRLTFDRDEGFSNQMGLSALERKSGKPLSEEYSEKLQERMGEISKNLGNDAQRAMFSAKANDLISTFKNQAIKHEADQYQNYAMSVREGTIKNSMNEIGLNYNNPEMIDQSILSIKSAVNDQARFLGKSATWAEAQAKTMTSKAHTVAVTAALEKNDPEYADMYLKKYKDQLEADDLLKINGLITKEMDQKISFKVANDVMAGVVTKMNTSDLDRFTNVHFDTESGNRQFDSSGKTLVSKADAIGAAQVKRTTGPDAAKLAGLPWDESRLENDPAYNRALGKAYLVKQLKDFGSLDQASAAYNAGPGAVREAIKKAEQANKAPSATAGQGKTYLDFLPKETQDYVAKNMKKYYAGGGQFEKPSLLDVQREVRSRLGPDASPQRLKLALDEAERMYDDVGKAIKQEREEAVSRAMQSLVANGGRVSQLDPQTRMSIPAEDMDKVMTFAQRIAKGDDITNEAVYQKLSTDENYLKSMSDAQFYMLRGELSQDDFKKFADYRGKLRTGRSSDKADDLSLGPINQIVNQRLQQLGIDPSPKDTNKNEVMRVAAIRKFVTDEIAAAQMNDGKKFNEAELSKKIDEIFARQGTQKGGWFSSDKTGRMLVTKPSEIPSDVRKRIVEDLKRSNGSEPTEGEILEGYFKIMQFKRNGASGRW